MGRTIQVWVLDVCWVVWTPRRRGGRPHRARSGSPWATVRKPAEPNHDWNRISRAPTRPRNLYAFFGFGNEKLGSKMPDPGSWSPVGVDPPDRRWERVGALPFWTTSMGETEITRGKGDLCERESSGGRHAYLWLEWMLLPGSRGSTPIGTNECSGRDPSRGWPSSSSGVPPCPPPPRWVSCTPAARHSRSRPPVRRRRRRRSNGGGEALG